MEHAPQVQQSSPSSPRASARRRTLARLVAAGALVVGSLAVAAPSWAGPLTGC